MSRSNAEHRIQADIADFLAMALPLDCFFSAIDHSDKASALAGAILKARGGKAGLPDLFVIWGGVFHGLEVKSSTGRLSASQLATAAAIRRAGGQHHVVHSSYEAEAVLRGIGIPLRATHLPLDGGRARRTPARRAAA